ncbi:hypothetical protein Phi4:1_gp067 [Cellulophaga phage phi4:1]|uniref:Uncharacterized protein n=3 Tax=Lightbulbvirus Cba41 TaxID=1918524 RepID=A0A0S2MWG9_9CAUD|nr:terminase large subunit [Cellulophaga phage phi4:1]AGO49480.1 hypothetical protein Phi4:1_gp067 [Cellulophaga phage phi4:1]ALO80076.1 hypothetical protein Phi4113_067 [Cellulophaga phage phi4:1_13]ALO80273.1 hypothetical protein Phi4118_067 [Cellulophaga phage phi4:1_18]
MSDYVSNFSKQNEPQLEKFKDYIEDKANNWTEKEDVFDKEDEYKVQQSICTTIFTRLKHFASKAEADLHLKDARKILDLMSGIIRTHTDRVDSYLNAFDITELKNSKNKTNEISLQNKLFKEVEKLKDDLLNLNIDEDNKDLSGITFFDNVKAPLSMHWILVDMYPDIKSKIEAMAIDFDSPPDNEFLIHKKNIPEWNTEKHYFEQDRDTLQFYVDEFKKIRNGIEISGVYIHPWLYFHLNVFKTDIPMPVLNKFTKQIESKDIFMHPPLRDNEWYIIQDAYREAETEQLILFIAATRRLFKSTGLASHFQWKTTIGAKELLIAGASAKDLGQVAKNYKKSVQGAEGAFALNNLTNDWSTKVELGLKKKSGKKIPQCVLHVINLNAGGEKSSEVLAGYTPDGFAIDEVMKAAFIEQLDAAKPSFDSPYGKRCIPILSGTGGNEELSADALTVLADPRNNGILDMNWEKLERNIPKEDITWKRQKFGTFAPAQMSAKDGMIKREIGLWEYLGVDKTKELDQVRINVTDWKRCNEIILADREKLKKNRKSLVKEIVYYPIDPEEIFQSGNSNPFPVEVGKRHRNKIIEEGRTGKKVDFFEVNGQITYDFSSKPMPTFPHNGGNIECPILMFEDVPEVRPPYGLYVAGLDDYKQEKSDGDSLGAIYIFKRQLINDQYSYKIAASLVTRPAPHTKFYRQIKMLLDGYNAICLMENEDIGFIEDLAGQNVVMEQYLQKTFNMSGDVSIQGNGNRQFGLSPTANKKTVIGAVVKYCNKKHKVYNEDGSFSEFLGIELIDDLGLLEELIKYNDKGNFDRVIAFGHALIQDHYFTANYITFNEEVKPKDPKEVTKKDKARNHKTFARGRGRYF